MKFIKGFSIGFVALIVLLLLGPFLVPVPPLENALSVEQLIDEDSRFIKVNGVDVHYKIFGQGQPVMILLHGFGASLFSWREVTQALAAHGTVIAYDRPAFGFTERPLPGEWQGISPYGVNAQADMLVGLMDALQVKEAVLIGNSAGGSVAALTAMRYPERVRGLVAVDAAIYTEGGFPAWLTPLMRTPQMRHIGPLLVRGIADSGNDTICLAWHDVDKVTVEIIEGYRKPLQVKNWDKAVWEFSASRENLNLPARLADLRLPVLVVSGDDDRIIPLEESQRLAKDIPGAQLIVFNACGHVPQEECPDQFLAAVLPFVQSLP